MNEELQFIIDFYEKSWNNLLTVIGGAGILLGIIWPGLIVFLNLKGNSNYKKEFDNIIKEKKEEFGKSINDALEKIDEKTKMLEDRIMGLEITQNRFTANAFFSQAQSSDAPCLKIYFLLCAYMHYLYANDTNGMNMVYFHMSPFFQHNQQSITNDTISREQLYMLINIVDDVISTLNQLNAKLQYKHCIAVFEDFKSQLSRI